MQPHLVLETLTAPAAQQGGGMFPLQHDFLSVIVEGLEGRWLSPSCVIVGALASRVPFLDFDVSIQLVSLVETWPSAILFDAVNTTGIRKNTLLSPGGEVSNSSVVMFTPAHSDTRPRV